MRGLCTYLFFSLIVFASYGQYNFDLVNSVYDEQYPVIAPEGSLLYFTRANHPENIGGLKDKGDIWFSTLIDDQWSSPIHMGSVINNSNWNAVLGFSNDGNTMVLHHHYRDNKQGLSISQKRNGSWTSPVALKVPYFLNRSTFQSGSVSDDGEIIVLSIESYNTKGGEDIYVLSKKSDGSWSDPKNLGNIVNTKYQEVSPYLAEDNKTLFFASNGHANGHGSFDIYRSTRQDDSWTIWSTPENLGKKINSEGRESSYQYFADSGVSVFVSTLDSDGYGDMKSIRQNEPIQKLVPEKDTTEVAVDTTTLVIAAVADTITINSITSFSFAGTIKDAKTEELLEATLLLTSIESGMQTTYPANDGEFNISLPLGSYHLGVEAKGYLSKFLTIQVDSIATKYQIAMAPIVVGETVNLKSVLFSRGTDELLPSSYDELNAVVKMMESNTSMEIALGGHTDNQGSSKLNYNLSEKRVAAVKKYLQSKGISGRRIEGKGYGGTRPIASNKNEGTRKLNRRVEFTVTKK